MRKTVLWILQAWYNLSDEGLEKQIARDLMFRRFIDLSISEAVSDHSPFKEMDVELLFGKQVVDTRGSWTSLPL